MNLLTTRTAVIATGLLIPGFMLARDPAILMQDYTSDISVTKVESNILRQQVGAPFGVPVVTEGKAVAAQGMFAFLTDTKGISTGVEMNYFNTDGFGMAYDQSVNAMRLNVPENYGRCKLTVIDPTGATILSEWTDNAETVIKLPQLAPGIYLAAAKAENNSSIKTIKFVVK